MRTLVVLATLVAQATFASRTVVVVVPVSVNGAGGRAITGLSKEQFHVYDDGRPQVITTFARGDAAVTLGLVVDRSASMRQKLSIVTDAIARFARSARATDELFVVNFNEKVSRSIFTSGPFTSDATELQAAVAGVRAAGTTALYDAVMDAMRHLSLGTAVRKALIVISDGADNASRNSYQNTAALVREVGAVVYTIGLSVDPKDRHSNDELGRLARDSGGSAFVLRTVDEISTVLDEVVRDMRDQYLLGFIPEQARSSGLIRVTADVPGQVKVTVRSRSSYTLPVSVP